MYGHWRIDPDGGGVLVTAIAPVPHTAAHLWQPRVSPKVGLGLPLDRIFSLVDEIAAAVCSSAAPNVWSAPGVDHTEGFVYVQGPVGSLVPAVGYQPLPQFVLTRDDLFGLGRRLTVLKRHCPVSRGAATLAR